MSKTAKRIEMDLSAIYKGFWKCRDLEIQMLWTRLTLLGAFMAMTYAGYGVLLMKAFEKMHNWQIFNLLALGMCCFGMVFSLFWILTAKGSKAWYEIYELALRRFQETNEPKFERYYNGDLVLSYLDFQSLLNDKDAPKCSSRLFEACGGPFSVSKIPILLGQVSLGAWILLSAVHSYMLILGKHNMRVIFENKCVTIVYLLLAITAIVIILVKQASKSSFFNH